MPWRGMHRSQAETAFMERITELDRTDSATMSRGSSETSDKLAKSQSTETGYQKSGAAGNL